MIAEIAAANAAFQVIKTAISNGKELYDCSAATQKYFDSKSVIAKRVASKGKSDLEAFMALEKIKEQEVWLKEHMVYAGRPDMYTDWLNFQAECRRNREAEAKRLEAVRRTRVRMFKTFFAAIAIGLAVIPIMVYGIILMVKR